MYLATFLLSVVLAQTSPSSTELTQRNVEFHYKFTIQEVPQGSKSLAVWIPIPPNTKYQTVRSVKIENSDSYTELSENEYGNHVYYFDLKEKANAGGNFTVHVIYQIERKAYRALESRDQTLPIEKEKLARFLSPDKLVPIDGRVAAEASQVAGKESDPIAQARKLYDNAVNTMKYDKSGQGWGRGDAIYACDVRKGNCTDFHSLFIGQARSLKIPARFLMGFTIPESTKEGKIAGYHCWAEFYVEGKGWIPVDASDASRYPEKKDNLFGGLDASRVEFTMGRDVRLPKATSEFVNFFIYPYVELEGKQHTKIQNEFSFRDLP